MVSLKNRNCRARKLPAASKTLLSTVAVVIAFAGLPTEALAQAAGSPVDMLPPCASKSADLPIQMVMFPFVKIEPSAGPIIGSKSTAILGGIPSKLEQMRMAQASGDIRTALLANNAPTSALEDNNPFNCSAPTAVVASAFMAAPSVFIPENAILGTMSVSIKHTPFDRDWAAVNGKQTSRKMLRTLTATGARGSGDQAAQVEAVNRWVNRSITYGEDRDIYGRADYWAPASETLRRGTGDCEDFAIAKMELLSVLGIARDKMRLVVARDLVRNADHAVLVVTLAGGAVMLDNVTDQLLDARLPNDYRPIMSFSQNAKWLHGYSMQSAPPVKMAAANTAPTSVPRKMADVLTVTQEPEMPTISVAMLSAPLMLPISL
jgi:predicted transglutaminase-like cysteine proteinase